MKKLLCFLLCLTLIFSSVSLCFAATDVSDATTHTQLSNIYNLLNGTNFSGRLATIANKLTDINANLVTLMGWLDPANGGGTTAILNQILNTLVYTNAGGVLTSWLADIQGYNYQTAVRLLDIKNIIQGTRNYSSILFNSPGANGTVNSQRLDMSSWNMGDRIFTYLSQLTNSTMSIYSLEYSQRVNGYNTSQTFTKWDDLTTSTFTPISATDGIYKWLSKIQYPVSRLSYVLASDERIEAQEAAAANEEAVVDYFIDSSGAGASSPSDIGSVSGLSSGYKQNFATDASPSGIFDIFNSDHATWFSQETKNQLDTTSPSRLSKGSASETPLLDKQIEDIYDALGVKQP